MNHTERLAFTEGIFNECQAYSPLLPTTKYCCWLDDYCRVIEPINWAIANHPDLPRLESGEPVRDAVIRLIEHLMYLARMVADDQGIPCPDMFEECLDIMRTKGLSYASQADAAENFKIIGAKRKLTKYQVLSVYYGKHELSVFNAIGRNPELPKVADGETIFSRLQDKINYAVLLAMMVQDDEKNGYDVVYRNDALLRDIAMDGIPKGMPLPDMPIVTSASEVARVFGEPMSNGRIKCNFCGKTGPDGDWEQLHNCVPFDPAGEGKKK